MNTYILFFGKSQDFTFYAFDNAGLIADFNAIIRNFDQLESNIFSVDDADNRDILAKYVFSTSKGKVYSLLKLYSCAQASNGSRISGSTYGVALLSEGDVQMSKFNVSLLQSAKQSFAKLSLSGIKFSKSDFLEEAKKLWNGIINSDSGNYLRKVEILATIPKLYKTEISAFHVSNLVDGAIELNGLPIQSNKVYVTTDFDHLKRVYEKWGEIKFPLYVKHDNAYQPFADITPSAKRLSTTEIKDLQSELAILKDDVLQLRRGYGKKMEEYLSRLMKLAYICAGLFLIIYFLEFYSDMNRSAEIKILQDSVQSNQKNIQLLEKQLSDIKKNLPKSNTTNSTDSTNT